MMQPGKLISAILLCLAAVTGATAQEQFAFRISFTDKKGTPADIHNPSGFLSTAAQARRIRQSIAIDSTDLPLSGVYTDSVLHMTGGILHGRSRWLNQCVILISDTGSISAVRSRSFVRSATYIAYYSSPLHLLRGKQQENEKLEKAVDNNLQTARLTSAAYYGDAFSQISLANGDYLHGKGYRGKGKMIAVIDAGFQNVNTLPGYDSLRREGRLADTYNFTLDVDDVYGYSSHGTQVLSTMAGILNGSYVGTAPDASYALYISEDNFTEQPIEMDNLVAAMERADSTGADVISISLGYNTFLMGTLNASLSYADIDGKSTVAAAGANKATAKGILVVASAGNDGGGSWRKILTPGDADSALTIGNVDINKLRYPTSGAGPNSSGVLKPDVCMLGAPSAVFNTSGTVTTSYGTSLSTPELAGLAACLWEAVPAAGPSFLRDVIRKSAHVASSPDTLLGYGVPDFKQIAESLNIQGPGKGKTELVLYPNPFFGELQARIQSDTSSPFSWSLTDIQGRLILSGSGNITAGSNEFHFPTPGRLPAGLYFMKFTSGASVQVYKLLHL